jgi:hypothetical protein
MNSEHALPPGQVRQRLRARNDPMHPIAAAAAIAPAT